MNKKQLSQKINQDKKRMDDIDRAYQRELKKKPLPKRKKWVVY